MIYRNLPDVRDRAWSAVENAEAGTIARDFLVCEYDLLRFTRTQNSTVSDLGGFLDATEGFPLLVHRDGAGEVLVTSKPWSESLLLTGRTADVLCGYLDHKVVRMEDRFDMTVRQSVRAM
ncbi:MAG TPA: hypothetical protein VFT12_03555 [Thermoanaerobaculia bacterium]|nr:hypothetical protein [Thermoanaerobaculia bacterium]